MECLDSPDGWMDGSEARHCLNTGDWDFLQEVVCEAPRSLQSCLSGKAVHGDSNPNTQSFGLFGFKPPCTALPSEQLCNDLRASNTTS